MLPIAPKGLDYMQECVREEQQQEDVQKDHLEPENWQEEQGEEGMAEEEEEEDFEDVIVMLLQPFHDVMKEKSSPADDALHAHVPYHALV